MTKKTKKISIAAMLLMLAVGTASARTVEPFNGGWSFRRGPFTADRVLFGGVFESGWREVQIPHTWNATDMQSAKGDYYAGEAYYRKAYTPDSALRGKRVFLRFGGVGSVAEIYVNRKYAGGHKGAYAAFAIEITALLTWGSENEILVKADNTPRPDVIPVNNTLFGVYGGIYRPVELIVTENVGVAVTDFASPGVYISQREVTRSKALVEVKVKLENKRLTAQPVTLKTTVYEAGGKVKAQRQSVEKVLPQGRQAFTHAIAIPNPRLWQGREDPYLYSVVVQVIGEGRVLDEVVQPLGLRRFELRAGEGMFLNGKKTPMYGVCRHQDWWQLGSALSAERHDTDLEMIMEVGATTVRLAHYQQAERMYAKCDSLGLMVWAEIPFVNRVSTQEADNARLQLVELIRQNYNHPSIYIWGLHNEVYAPYPYTVALTADLHDIAKSEDPYRYTASVNGHSALEQPANLNADVQGINHYFGWYGGEVGDVKSWVEKMERQYPGYRVIFSEYGAEANVFQQEERVGEHGRYFSQFYPETFATKFHEVQWGVIAKHPYLLASYVWNMFDFATPATAQGGIPARNMKGLVTFDRKVKKDPFYWYKANWSREPVLYITQRRADRRVNPVTSVTVYSNVGAPTLYVNGAPVEKYAKGTTDVHYIFENVALREGKNDVEAKVVQGGNVHSDAIVWTYSATVGQDSLPAQEAKRTKEHVGID
ncbi:MAG: beta-galactosidase [Prevotellaceae bacterium]|jgi:beta-galactosidase|nr:beta-galactosidase [Prevotellaceae bacterium]